MTAENPMWTCPEWGRRFANKGQVHTCGELTDLDSHFVNSDENVRATFDEFVEAVPWQNVAMNRME